MNIQHTATSIKWQMQWQRLAFLTWLHVYFSQYQPGDKGCYPCCQGQNCYLQSRAVHTESVAHDSTKCSSNIANIEKTHRKFAETASRRQHHGEQCLPFLCRARPMNRGSRPKRRYYFAAKRQVVKQSVTSTPSFVSLSISFIFARAVGVCPSAVRRHKAFFRQCQKRYSYRHDDLKSST
jgi:hypothetical protein